MIIDAKSLAGRPADQAMQLAWLETRSFKEVFRVKFLDFAEQKLSVWVRGFKGLPGGGHHVIADENAKAGLLKSGRQSAGSTKEVDSSALLHGRSFGHLINTPDSRHAIPHNSLGCFVPG